MNNNKTEKQERLKQKGYENQNIIDDNKGITTNKRRRKYRIKNSTKDVRHKCNSNINANDKTYKSIISILSLNQHRDLICQNDNDNVTNNNTSSKDNNIHSCNIQQNESGNST